MTPDPDLGQRPHPNTVPCADCGHVWFDGERRHDYVDADGTVTIDDDGEVACTLCCRKRARGWRPKDDEGGFHKHW